MNDAGLDGLSTARLQLRRFTLADEDLLSELHSNPEVTRYMGGVKTAAQNRALLETRILRYYEEHPGLGIWITSERGTGQRIGFHLLNNIQGEEIIQVGYCLLPAYWGKGYATEMCRALLDYGFETLKLPKLHAITDLGNTASQQVLLKSGLLRQGERFFAHPAYAASGPMAYFEQTVTGWQVPRAH
ncbi:MAG: GNAT family N-acetyltransferase [Pseudomonadota bacterium]